MKKITESLYQSKLDCLFGKKEGEPFCRSAAYLLVSSFSNTLFYSSKDIEDHFDFIIRQGGVSFQMLNHRNEASSYSDKVLEKFNAPLICHHLEEEAVVTKQGGENNFRRGHFWRYKSHTHSRPLPGKHLFSCKTGWWKYFIFRRYILPL